MSKVMIATCEFLANPVGVSSMPRFSWQLSADGRDVVQKARHIQVAEDSDFQSLMWDSGNVMCDQSVHVPYDGAPLAPDTRYWWRVRSTDNRGRDSGWIEAQWFVTALFSAEEWHAEFISGESEQDAERSAGTMVRGEFALKDDVRFAVIHATALGVYQLHLNGQRVSDWAMTPGWTEYKSRLLYQSFDVTSLLKKGANVCGALLGAGWYKGDLAGWVGRRNVYGKQTAFAMQLTVVYQNGESETLTTDSNWKASQSPVLYSEIYHGEAYDARGEQRGWDRADFDASDWTAVRLVPVDSSILAPQDGPPVRAREVLSPVSIFTTPNGERIVDFGQILTGWVKLKVKGESGDIVKYSHAEILDANGNFYTGNLRSAKQKIVYTLRGGEAEAYEPKHTFQGFRYIRIDAFPGEANADNFEAVVAHSDMRETGSFKCSNEKLNQLEHNIRWGMKGNFFDIPTDCPQRDERLGWTGDAQVFVRTACYLHDTNAFYQKWLRDLAVSQFPDGGIPYVVPDVLSRRVASADGVLKSECNSSGWGDAAVICPWTVYKYSGDAGLLREQYATMKGWVEFIRANAQDGLLWNTGFHLGDWVALDAKEGSYFGATPTDLIATAYYARCVELLAKAAESLGNTSESRAYFALRGAIGDAFANEFFTENGRLAANTQTAHILALYFGLVPARHKRRTLSALAKLLNENDNHLSTGFLGTPYICYALSENGRLDLAYELLLKEDYPSWLYPLSKGATTIWEHWDGMKPDGTMWSDDMNSFNHYAYGAVADWIYSVIGGLDSSEDRPGYKHSLVYPRPGGGISTAEIAVGTPYGALSSAWKIMDNVLSLDVTIPPNTSATIVLPGGKITQPDGLCFAFDGRGQSANAGSGSYHFELEWTGVKS